VQVVVVVVVVEEMKAGDFIDVNSPVIRVLCSTAYGGSSQLTDIMAQASHVTCSCCVCCLLCACVGVA
jgi:hypothetical protein